MDAGGALAAHGRRSTASCSRRLLANPWFDRPMPKSLDRHAFSLDAVAGLSTEDGAATLAAFTSRTIVKGIVMAGGAERIVVAGGGAHNPVLMRDAGGGRRNAGRKRGRAWLVAGFHRGGGVRLSGRAEPRAACR